RLRQIRDRIGAGVWTPGLIQVARDGGATPRRRVRALDLLAQFSAPRSEYEDLLAGLAREDKDPSVRAQAVLLLGALATDKARSTLVETLADSDAFVRRRACEALVRTRGSFPQEKVRPLLGDPDRFVRYAARNALEHADPVGFQQMFTSMRPF